MPTSPVGLLTLVCPRWAGNTICDSTREKIRQQITVDAITPITCPKKPIPKSRGIKATTVVNTPKVTGMVTRCAPSIAPASCPSPSWCLECTLSPITIASSTRMPRTSMNPNMDIASIESPIALVRNIAPRNATGTPTLTQKASRGRKKSASRISTIRKP